MPDIFGNDGAVAKATKKAKAGSAKGGGTLNRTETVTIRLDPRLNYLCDLAARAHRRSKSSFVEWAIEQALQLVRVPGTQGFDENEDATLDEIAVQLWDIDEADRLAALAFQAPSLMTHEEQVLWKIIRDYGWVWKGVYVDDPWRKTQEKWTWTPDAYDKLILKNLRDNFDDIKLVAAGEKRAEELHLYSNWREKTPTTGGWTKTDDLDDDIPF